MSLSLYMDVHVPRAITRTLTAAGVDVITAQVDGCSQMPDPDLLDRAGTLGRILFTRDDDLLAEATRRQLSMSLRSVPGAVTVQPMITIESTEKEIRVSIPRDEVDPVRLERLLRPFRLETAVSGGGMTDEEADLMAEEMKAKWWAENRHRFLPTEPT